MRAISICCSARGGRHEPRVASPLRFAAALALAGCNNGNEPTYQGWVEAELIFVGPDEAGRIETLAVREGDQVEQGAPLFTVDADLQLADVAMQEAAVEERAAGLSSARSRCCKTAGRHAKALDDAEAALRTAQARLNSAQTRLGAPQGVQPGRPAASSRSTSGRAKLVPAGKPVVALLPPGNIKVRFFVNEAMLPKLDARRPRQHPLRRLRQPVSPPRSASSPAPRSSRRR